MDPIQIILTIAACIGGLLLLWRIIAIALFSIAARRAEKFVEHDDFFGSFNRR